MMKPTRLISAVVICLALLMVACQPVLETNPATPTTFFVSTATEMPTEPCLGQDCLPSLGTETSDPMRFVLPTPGAEPVSSWRPPLYPIPWAPSIFDHFYFPRPIAADTINWPLPDYRYGGVLLKSSSTHTGIDIPAALGTPVLAVGPGDVIWAGWGLFTGDLQNEEDPYGLAVVIRHDFGYDGQRLYTVYAHMQQVAVVPGQWLDTGEILGQVGATGHASGSHLHFEVRLGSGDNFSTRNPELWLAPPQGLGVLVARITDFYKKPLDSVPISVESISSGQTWEVHTYRSEEVNSDDYYRENMVLSDLPAGKYLVSVPYKDTVQELEIEVYPGQVTYFSFRGFLLFNLDLPSVPEPDSLQTPSP